MTDTSNEPQSSHLGAPEQGWRLSCYNIIFESDTRAGRVFDLVLLLLIVTSVAVVMLDSVEAFRSRWESIFNSLEWVFTLIFTAEFMMRILCVKHPKRYVLSPFGIIDFISFAPTYLALFFPGLQALIDVRVLRMLRIFRILKLGAYVKEYSELASAIVATRRKIAVFLSFVLMVVVVLGTLMYVVEGPANGFTSIPVSIYWAITTVTTVGFGDITAKTDLGRFIASLIMLMGWGTLAVPTGIVSAEFASRRAPAKTLSRFCPHCQSKGHSPEARFCCDCGGLLPD